MQSIKAKAFSLLAKRAYFSKQLERKLLEKGYSQKEITPLIRTLIQDGWLNDRDLAQRFIEKQKQKGYGSKIIALQLREKAGPLDLPIEESEEAVFALIKRRYLSDLPQKRNKVINALLRRGISYDLINKILESISKERE